MNPVNYLLDRITMYRLVLYFLIILLSYAVILSFAGVLPYKPTPIVVSSLILVLVCYLSNKFFARLFGAQTNIESSLITSLILSSILFLSDLSPKSLILLSLAGVIAMASKYFLAIHKKHIFNPAAIAVVITGLTIGFKASWWVGGIELFPVVLLGGLLITKKTQRFDLVATYFTVSALLGLLFSIQTQSSPISYLQAFFTSSSLFFGFIMLTEPLTSPTTRKNRMIYAAIVGILGAPQLSFGSFSLSPEMTLIIGNIFAFAVGLRYRFVLPLAKKIPLSRDVLEFSFVRPSNFDFKPGQYLEWTLPHKGADSRGDRRYFTIASSPTEEYLKLGVKFYENGSSFKSALKSLGNGGKITGGQLSGDFTLPIDSSKHYVFIAGGIGITPFRSMIRYLMDKNRKMNITLIYSNKNITEIVYKELFDEVQSKLGIKIIYTLTDENSVPENWTGGRGRVSAGMIERIPEYKIAQYFLSGPHALVSGFEKTLYGMGIPRQQVKRDFFPGFV